MLRCDRGFALRQISDVVVPATVVASYDPSDDANLTLNPAGVGPPIAQMTDLSGNSLHLINGTDATRPDRVTGASGINNVQCAQYAGTGLDVLSVTAASTFRNKNCIGFDMVGTVQDLSELCLMWRILSSGANAGLMITQAQITTGVLRIVTRRLASDANVAKDSSFRMTLNQQHFIACQCNYGTGEIDVWFDDEYEQLIVLTNGVRGWASGLGNTDDAGNASAAHSFGRNGSSHTNMLLGPCRLWTGQMTSDEVQARMEAMQAIYATPQRKVTVNAPAALFKNKVYEADAGAHDVSVSGNVIVGTDAMIQYRLINAVDYDADGTRTQIQALANIGNSVDLAFSGTISVPEGPSCYAAYRKDGDANADERVDTQNRLSVGMVMVVEGASNTKRIHAGNRFNFVPYPITKPASGINLNAKRSTGYAWASCTDTLVASQNSVASGEPYPPLNPGPLNEDCGGNGFSNLQLLLQPLAIGIGYGAYAIGSSGSPDWAPGGYNYEFEAGNIDTAGNIGTEYRLWHWGGGEFDINLHTSKAAYKTFLETRYTYHKDRTGNANLRATVMMPGPMDTGEATDESAQAIREAVMEFIDDNAPDVTLAWSLLDHPLDPDDPDPQHPSKTVMMDVAVPRWAAVLRNFADDATYPNDGQGPRVTASANIRALAGGNIVRIKPTINLDDVVALVDGAGDYDGVDLTGCEVQVGGVDRTVTDAILHVRTITAISLAADGEVTTGTAHNLTTGDKVKIFGGDMVEIDEMIVTATVTAADKFTTGVDTSGFTPYTTGGTCNGSMLELTIDGAALASTNVVGFRYMYGKLPDITNVVRDDSVIAGLSGGFPMWPTIGFVTFTVA